MLVSSDTIVRARRSTGFSRILPAKARDVRIAGIDHIQLAIPAGGEDRVRGDEPFDGRRRMYVDDPFGNRIELIDAGDP